MPRGTLPTPWSYHMAGKHRAYRRLHAHNARRLVNQAATITMAAVAATTGISIAEAGTADAAPGADWNSVAQCESSGNWSIHTGVFEGGLQFLPSTWLANGG